jgi:hypothetical protein
MMVNLHAKKSVSGTLLIRGNLTLLLQLNKSRSVCIAGMEGIWKEAALTCFKVRLFTTLAVARKNKELHK